MAMTAGDMNEKIHGMPMPDGCIRVLVDGSINDNALVPVPVLGEIEKVFEAVGSHVAWPKDLIIFPTVVVCISFSFFIVCVHDVLQKNVVIFMHDKMNFCRKRKGRCRRRLMIR